MSGNDAHGPRDRKCLPRACYTCGATRRNRRGYQTAGPDGGGKRATPYGIFVLPRSDKELVVEEGVRTLKNEPPKWNELARFTALRP